MCIRSGLDRTCIWVIKINQYNASFTMNLTKKETFPTNYQIEDLPHEVLTHWPNIA